VLVGSSMHILLIIHQHLIFNLTGEAVLASTITHR